MMSMMAVMGCSPAGIRWLGLLQDRGRLLSCAPPSHAIAGRDGPMTMTVQMTKPLQLGRPVADPGLARRGHARPRAQSARRHQLRRPLHRAGIHLALPGHRPAGFRPSGDRLCAGPLAGRIEIAQALSRQLPQPRRLPRGLHGRHRQDADRACSSRNGCASAATGIRAAACRSTCSGRPASLPKGVWVPDQGVAPYRGRGYRGRRRPTQPQRASQPAPTSITAPTNKTGVMPMPLDSPAHRPPARPPARERRKTNVAPWPSRARPAPAR